MENGAINLLDFWKVLVREKRLIAAIVGLATFTSIVVSLLLPKSYRAQATLLPVGGQKVLGSPMANIAAQIGMNGLLGGGESSMSPQIVIILRSKTLAERVVEQNNLMPILAPDSYRSQGQEPMLKEVNGHANLARVGESLSGMVSLEEDRKSRLISIYVTAGDPELAATIANGYLRSLADYISESTLTGAKRNRIFIEHQLERNKTELLESGKELASFYATNKISNVIPTVDVDVSSNQSSEVGPESVSDGPPTVSPSEEPSMNSSGWVLPGVSKVMAATAEKTAALQRNLEAAEAKIREAKVVKNVPQQIYLQYLSIRRDLLSQVNVLLTQQYEMAKIEEAKEDLTFQVIDWARVPLTRFEPQRRKIVSNVFVLSAILSILLVLAREYLKNIKEKMQAGNI